jgi:hypothetical protein
VAGSEAPHVDPEDAGLGDGEILVLGDLVEPDSPLLSASPGRRKGGRAAPGQPGRSGGVYLSLQVLVVAGIAEIDPGATAARSPPG